MPYYHDTNLRDLDPEARCYKSKYERNDEAFDEMEADEDRHKERDEDND